jgi:NAD(P)-dependent dehydrogenase (short-subunit alcohol dehydrogenase family)
MTAQTSAGVVEEIVVSGGRGIAVEADVTARDAVEDAIDEVEDRLGPLTVLVNNAGTCHAIGPVSALDPDDWWREVEIHVRGAVLASHFALARMIPRRRGRIINIYGNLGDTRGAYSSAYAVAKAALLRLTEQVAGETADTGVGAFALHPGLVATSMIDELATDKAARRWLPGFSTISPERFLAPDQLVAAVVAIASGAVDALSGRYLGAWEDIQSVAADAPLIIHEDRRVLRITGL